MLESRERLLPILGELFIIGRELKAEAHMDMRLEPDLKRTSAAFNLLVKVYEDLSARDWANSHPHGKIY